MNSNLAWEKLQRRFWSRVRKTESCWLWVGQSLATGGYGYISFKRKMKRAHRLSYEFIHGPIPRHVFVCHKCDNPRCVNPDHLFLGTPKDNVWDMHAKGRAVKAVGEFSSKAKLTPSQVIEIKNNYPKSGMSFTAFGRLYGVKHSSISNIMRGNNWKHLFKDKK